MTKKMNKKTVKSQNKRVTKNNIIIVKNADGDPDTTAEIIVQNKISYKPRVSVIIPVYNVEKYLPQCLDSVVNQTLPDIEIICVDDGSTDSSLDILKDYARRDKRITVLRQKNLHAGVARNAGLSIARGEYLSFLDSDDFFELDMLDQCYAKLKTDKSDVCIFSGDMIDYKNNVTKEMWWLCVPETGVIQIDDVQDKIFNLTSPNCWNKIFNAKLISKYNLKFQSIENANDVYFSYAAVAVASKISIIKEKFIHYRYNTGNQITENLSKLNPLNIYIAFDELKRFLTAQKCQQLLQHGFYNRVKNSLKYQIQENPDNFYSHLDTYAKLFDKSHIQMLQQEFAYNIVFATNDNYAKYLVVALQSLVENSNKNYFYNIAVFHSGLSQKSKNDILSVKSENISIKFINVNQYIQSINLYSKAHYSTEMYYRILIPRLFPNAHRVLYLDCDIVILRDVADIFQEQIGDNYIAAIHNYVGQGMYNYLQKMGINPDDYFNSGVLLINVDKWNSLHLEQKCFDLVEKYTQLACPDQDILNMVCKDNVKYIDGGWNFMWQSAIGNSNVLSQYKALQEKSKQNISIVHYTSAIKPWNHPELVYARHWWYYAKHTSLYKSFVADLDYKQLLSDWYNKCCNKYLNLYRPVTFNEKIQWLKLYDSTPIKTRLADKLLVRDWVREKIGDKYLIPLLGVYDRFEDIDFSKLPKRFVIKCNHGSGWNIIVRDKTKLDLADVKKKLDYWMNLNFAFKYGYELHYREIQPKIMIEKFMENKTIDDLYDYKFWCFNGKVEYIQLLSGRNSTGLKTAFYSPDWKKQRFYDNNMFDSSVAPRPKSLAQMKKLAEKLSAGFNYVRVDFYQLDDGTIYFGEMTFTPASGAMVWDTDATNLMLGKMLKLPKRAYNIDTGEYYKLPRYSMLKTYALFPYYMMSMLGRRARLNKMNIRNIFNNLNVFRVDIKNFGASTNTVDVVASGARVFTPDWFKNESGTGIVVESSQKRQKIVITSHGDGTLRLSLRGIYKMIDGKRVPLWVTYNSVRIDGREILSKPISVWHDAPFTYEMPVKNDAQVVVDIETEPYRYKKTELTDIVNKMYPSFQRKKFISWLYKRFNAHHIKYFFRHLKSVLYARSRRYMLDLINQNHAAVMGAVADINRRCDTLQRQLDGMKSGIVAANSETQNNILARISEFSDEIRNVVTDGTASVLDMADVMRESSKKIAHRLEKHVTDNVRNVSDTVHTTLHGGIVQLDGRIASIHAVVKDSANLLNKKLHKSVDNARDELNTKITDMGNAVNVSVATASKNMTDAVDNMRHGMGDQISALNSEITTAVSAVGDAVQRNQSELSLRDSEQYWAHVYHDTISNSSWLNNKSVSPGRWAVSYIVLYVLYRILDEMRPTSILECGLGQSSKLTIQYARATGAKLMICENNPDWLNFFARQMPDAPDYTTILDAVNVQIVPPYESRTYHGFSDAIGKTKFNLVLIDGPRGSDHYSRPEILDIVDNLDASFVILLDDMNRIGEQETWRMLREKLKSRGIDFREGRYTSDKGLGIICSPDLAFLTSM